MVVDGCRGEGVEKNLNEAVKWYTQAAEAGNSGAQFNLGNCYKRGEGCQQDYPIAFKWCPPPFTSFRNAPT